MPVVDFKKYNEMLDNARKNKFAYPAINITSMTSANACLEAFAEMKCDGIIQVSTGGGEFASGLGVKNAALGAISLAKHVHFIAEQYDINVALHTDHCQPGKVESFLKPLLAESKVRVANGKKPLFNSHMFDGSELPLEENMKVAVDLLKQCQELGIILEVEAGVVGGEEDGVSNEDAPAENYIQLQPIWLMYTKVYPQLKGQNTCLLLLSETFTAFTNPATLN